MGMQLTENGNIALKNMLKALQGFDFRSFNVNLDDIGLYPNAIKKQSKGNTWDHPGC
jgi:hypothetical protein